jgi:hypothetical protein
VDLEDLIVRGLSPLIASEIAIVLDIDLRGSHEFISGLVADRLQPLNTMSPDGAETLRKCWSRRKLLNLKRSHRAVLARTRQWWDPDISERSGARRKQRCSIERTLNSAGVMKSTAKTSAARLRRMGSFEGDLRSGELHSLASTGKIVAARNQEKALAQ